MFEYTHHDIYKGKPIHYLFNSELRFVIYEYDGKIVPIKNVNPLLVWDSIIEDIKKGEV